jgi:hypothetical protein
MSAKRDGCRIYADRHEGYKARNRGTSKDIASFFMGLNSPVVPITAFATVKEASRWIKG